jgi:hypothetical protein
MVTRHLVVSPIPKVVLSKINYSKQFFGENWMSSSCVVINTLLLKVEHDLGWKVHHMKWKGRYLNK